MGAGFWEDLGFEVCGSAWLRFGGTIRYPKASKTPYADIFCEELPARKGTRKGPSVGVAPHEADCNMFQTALNIHNLASKPVNPKPWFCYTRFDLRPTCNQECLQLIDRNLCG